MDDADEKKLLNLQLREMQVRYEALSSKYTDLLHTGSGSQSKTSVPASALPPRLGGRGSRSMNKSTPGPKTVPQNQANRSVNTSFSHATPVPVAVSAVNSNFLATPATDDGL